MGDFKVEGKTPRFICYGDNSVKQIYVGGKKVWEKPTYQRYTNQVQYTACSLNKQALLGSTYSRNGYFMTPRIPVKSGDIVRCAYYVNGTNAMIGGSDNGQKLRFWKASSGGSYLKNYYIRSSAASDAVAATLKNGYIQFTIPSVSNANYVDITLSCNDNKKSITVYDLRNLIITVNEEIVPYETWLTPLSQDWGYNKVLDGSGNLRDSIGYQTTNFIPIKNGQILRLHQCSPQITAIYNSSKGLITTFNSTSVNASYFTKYDHGGGDEYHSGDLHWKCTNSNVAYVKISFQQSSIYNCLGKDSMRINSVVTVDQPMID